MWFGWFYTHAHTLINDVVWLVLHTHPHTYQWCGLLHSLSCKDVEEKKKKKKKKLEQTIVAILIYDYLRSSFALTGKKVHKTVNICTSWILFSPVLPCPLNRPCPSYHHRSNSEMDFELWTRYRWLIDASFYGCESVKGMNTCFKAEGR